MKIGKKISVLLFLILFATSVNASEDFIHHELKIDISPEDHTLKVEDHITIPASQLVPDIHFLLHGNLELANDENVNSLIKARPGTNQFDTKESETPEQKPPKVYSIQVPQDHHGDFTITVKYDGTIYHEIQQLSQEYQRSFSVTRGIISQEGVYLSGAAMWSPTFPETLNTFNLTVTLPESWDVVSQGDRTIHKKEDGKRKVRWESPNPVDDIYLIAGEYTGYNQSAGMVESMVFLRSPDEKLAGKYLETTAQYIKMYGDLIGFYPYKKFALIENFWETGYGMPSFTLLGPRVIRFPFILHSSYPHEILHNWWGNGVFVDQATGNWCEGLTAYLSDHLIKEQRGQGVNYRRSALQKYSDYVKKSSDFSLTSFSSRHDASTEAIGYGKSLMLFNMLRNEVGDGLFVKGLRAFYRDYKFKKASYNDICSAFETVSGKDLKHFFNQWTTRVGAPELRLSGVKAGVENNMFHLSFELSQIQPGAPYKLNVPIAFHLEGEEDARVENVNMVQARQEYEFMFQARPLRVDVDPQFEIFRKLGRNEIPPALSQVFGAEKVLIVLPSKGAPDKLEGYRKLAEMWKKEYRYDNDLTNIPNDRAIWLFGWNNKFLDKIIKGVAGYDTGINLDSVQFDKTTLPKRDHSFITAVRNPKGPENVLVWLATDNINALPGLGRKLPHYSKYSYLAFEGDGPSVVAKGQWPVIGSPMCVNVTQEDGAQPAIVVGKLPTRNALASLPPVFSSERMMKDVKYLASEELQGRGFGSPGLDKAADFITEQFKISGLQVITQSWQDIGGIDNKTATLRNIIGYIPGTKSEWKGQSVVVCAHYDHLGLGWPDARHGNEGKIHYGADDNASGVAVMLELARSFGKGPRPERTIIFAAFTGEESGRRGSKYYVENMKTFPVEKVIGAINLDTVGRLNQKKLLVIGSNSAEEWKHICMGIGYTTGIRSELVTQVLDSSDQVSFLKKGVPAIQLFTGTHFDYHCPGDTVDKIDAKGLAGVAMFTKEALQYLAERKGPMTFAGTEKSTERTSSSPKGSRKVSTGIMPDYTFTGKGIRIEDMSSGSPVAKASLRKGDVVVQVDEFKVSNLREYSDVLKKYHPGDKVTFVYIREGKEYSTLLIFTAR